MPNKVRPHAPAGVPNPAETRLAAKMVPPGLGGPPWNPFTDPARKWGRFLELLKRQPPIVGTPDHLEMLEGLAAKGRWKEVGKNLASQARNAVSYWKIVLGKKSGKGGRPLASRKTTRISLGVDKTMQLLPKFERGMADKKALSKEHPRNRNRAERELLRKGYSKEEIECFMLRHTPVSAALTYVSDKEKLSFEALEKAYRRRLHPTSGYGAAYGASYGQK